jgi:hypothetical protein
LTAAALGSDAFHEADSVEIRMPGRVWVGSDGLQVNAGFGAKLAVPLRGAVSLG